jgi:iron complex transport system permease protein
MARSITPIAIFGSFLVVAVVVASGVGAVDVGVLEWLSGYFGFGDPITSTQEAVLLKIRAPRIVLAALVGAGLSGAGASLQSVFRNPLADPGLIGVSAGATVGVVGWIVFATMLPWTLPQHPAIVPVAAFIGGLAATMLVLRLSKRGDQIDVATMLLAGIAVNAVAGAIVGLAIYASDEESLRTVTLWSLGSFAAADWTICGIVAVVTATAIAWLMGQTRSLDLLLLGGREASHLGVDVPKLRRGIVAFSALLVAASVGFTGTIGFVGLVVPHLVRLMFGPAHRFVLPGSVLLGAGLLVFTDAVSRTVVAPSELPIGIVTALFGGPFFLGLLLKAKARRAL